MGTPCSWDMKPRMEKKANPATKLVPRLRKQSGMLSLWAGQGREQTVSGAPSASGRDQGTQGTPLAQQGQRTPKGLVLSPDSMGSDLD